MKARFEILERSLRLKYVHKKNELLTQVDKSISRFSRSRGKYIFKCAQYGLTINKNLLTSAKKIEKGKHRFGTKKEYIWGCLHGPPIG